jgi:hypothetical protein
MTNDEAVYRLFVGQTAGQSKLELADVSRTFEKVVE